MESIPLACPDVSELTNAQTFTVGAAQGLSLDALVLIQPGRQLYRAPQGIEPCRCPISVGRSTGELRSC